MSIKVIKREVYINAPMKKVWQFMSAPHNLKHITPDYMNFTIVDCPLVKDIFLGMKIEYRVTPLYFPIKWVSLIERVEHQKEFVDVQFVGPYELWRHRHSFKETEHGVHMTDEVHYKLPFGFLGKMAHGIVKRRLEHIFDYREATIKHLFNVQSN